SSRRGEQSWQARWAKRSHVAAHFQPEVAPGQRVVTPLSERARRVARDHRVDRKTGGCTKDLTKVDANGRLKTAGGRARENTLAASLWVDYLCHEGVNEPTAVGGLERPIARWKISRSGTARHVSVTVGVHRDTEAPVITTSPQECGVDEGRT